MKQFRHVLFATILLLITAQVFAATPADKIQSPTMTPVTVPAETEAAPAAKPVESRLWNLQDADILSVINEVSLETGKNFVVDPRVTGKITLISSKPIKPNEVYQVFLSVLGILGYSAIQNGQIVKIVPNMESGEQATKVAGTNIARGDEVVVRVIPLDNISANQLIPVIRPLLPQWSNISAYTPGNVLILLGRANNLERIVTVIRDIDRSSSNNIDIVRLRQASASQLVTVLNNLQNAARATGDAPLVSIAADERSNSILLSGNKSARLHMRFLIDHLDTPSSGAQGNTEVIYLRYLQSVKFAPLLGKIAQNMQGKNSAASGEVSSTNVSNSGGMSATSKTEKTPENLTSIQAEPNTNAIVITAPPAMMTALNSVVAKLDIRPAQVLVEGIIVEVDDSSLKNLGIQWGSLVSSTTIPTPGSPSDFPPAAAGNIGIIPHTNIVAILSFLETQAGTNILSTPSVTVLDNQKAVLEIGQEVPIQTGSYSTNISTNTLAPFNTTTMKPVTLKLQVIPQINLGDAVRLLINLRNDSLQNPNSPGLNPIINTSNLQNSVIVNSEDVLVLGGLIRNSVVENTNKVPILGDVPLVGRLFFQQKSRQVEKKNLLVFIKPTILRNPDDASNITNTKYDRIRDAQLNWPSNPVKTQEKAPFVLPPWQNDTVLPKPFVSTEH